MQEQLVWLHCEVALIETFNVEVMGSKGEPNNCSNLQQQLKDNTLR